MERKGKDFLIKEQKGNLNIVIKMTNEICLINANQYFDLPRARLKAFSGLFKEVCNLDGTNYFMSFDAQENGVLAIYSSCDIKELENTIDEICADLNCYKNLLENLIVEGEKENG